MTLGEHPVADTAMIEEAYRRAERVLPWNAGKLCLNLLVTPNWLSSDRFWYQRETRDGHEIVLVDPRAGTKQPAFDHEMLAGALSQVTGQSIGAHHIPADQLTLTADGATCAVTVGQTRWRVDLPSYATREDASPVVRPSELPSPDGHWVAFLREYNLWVRSVETREERQLTTDGERFHAYAMTPDAVDSDVSKERGGDNEPVVGLWSPDSRHFLTHRVDERKIEPFPYIQHVPKNELRPRIFWKRELLAGRPLPTGEFLIIDVETGSTTWVKDEPHLVYSYGLFGEWSVWWSADGTSIRWLDQERSYRRLCLKEANATTGDTRVILEETGEPYVHRPTWVSDGRAPLVRFLTDGDIIWYSERDGWGHLYLVDGANGSIKRQITRGDWLVYDIYHVDEDGRWVYFAGLGREEHRDVYLRHIYRAHLDRDDVELLTPEDADHLAIFSPSGQFFVDTYSRVDTIPRTVLRSADGTVVLTIEDADIDDLLATGFRFPIPITVKAADGETDLFGAIHLPSTFDPTRRYPVLDDIYGGPPAIRAPKCFGAATGRTPVDWHWFWHAQAIAELGFVVVTVDGRGTAERSRHFLQWAHPLTGDKVGGIVDHPVAIRQLAEHFPWMDLDRVGVYGHSWGGYNSVRAMLFHPDLYKVGVSSAGHHDKHLDGPRGIERYMGLPQEQPDAYRDHDNNTHIHRLEGKLLLSHADLDGLPITQTFRLINSLTEANKDYDLMILPNKGHATSKIGPYFARRRWDYFVQHLMGVEPPRGYRIGAEQPDDEPIPQITHSGAYVG